MALVQEMFFSVYVRDVQRAATFYQNALGATVDYVSPTWSSLVVAGTRVSLELREHETPTICMHFVVDDLALMCAAVARAGGHIAPAVEAARGVVIAEALDTEGNKFTLRQRPRTNTEAAKSKPIARSS
jgi:predicted enzyme related to lactoylglutathione lyase